MYLWTKNWEEKRNKKINVYQYDCMISFFKVFLKANLWRDFVSSLNEFEIFAL